MRSRLRDRQKIWFSNVTEKKKVGIDTVQEYGETDYEENVEVDKRLRKMI